MKKLEVLNIVPSHQPQLRQLGVKSLGVFDPVPEVPWRLMSDMRSIMAHEYFQVNFKVTWSTIQNSLPTLIEPYKN